jgi:hypothetical protein
MQATSFIKILSFFLVILSSSPLFSMQHYNTEICNQLQEYYDDFAEGKEFSYECCNRSFTQRESLRSHLMIFHYICLDCVIQFSSGFELASHMRCRTTHGNKLCDYCKSIKTKSIDELNRHKSCCQFRPEMQQPRLQQSHNSSNVVNIQIKQEFYTSIFQQNFHNTQVHPLQPQANCLDELFNDQSLMFTEFLSGENLDEASECYEHICAVCSTSFPGATELEVHCFGEHLRCPWCIDFEAKGLFDVENKKFFALHAGKMHPEKNIHYCEQCDIFTDDIAQAARHVVSCGNNTSKSRPCPVLNIQPRPSV